MRERCRKCQQITQLMGGEMLMLFIILIAQMLGRFSWWHIPHDTLSL